MLFILFLQIIIKLQFIFYTTMKLLLVFVFSIGINLSAQTFSLRDSIGEFNSTSDFGLSKLGYFYVSDIGSDEILKIDTNGVLLKSIGGFGWDTGSFDKPVSVFPTGINIFVADFKNHRIQRFDKDLNFISSLNKRGSNNNDEAFGYPSYCVVNNQGDLFIVDTENKRILKFDIFGRFSISIGGFDAGKFSLSNPSKMAVSHDGKIYVIDGKAIIVFDVFGNGIAKQTFDFTLNDIKVSDNHLLITSTNSIWASDLKSSPMSFISVALENLADSCDFISSIYYNNKLFVLTQSKILIFNRN